jgi:hypothetical protein
MNPFAHKICNTSTTYNLRANFKTLYNRTVTVTILRKFTVCGERALHKLNLG